MIFRCYKQLCWNSDVWATGVRYPTWALPRPDLLQGGKAAGEWSWPIISIQCRG